MRGREQGQALSSHESSDPKFPATRFNPKKMTMKIVIKLRNGYFGRQGLIPTWL
jgi:hypothetical protein